MAHRSFSELPTKLASDAMQLTNHDLTLESPVSALSSRTLGPALLPGRHRQTRSAQVVHEVGHLDGGQGAFIPFVASLPARPVQGLAAPSPVEASLRCAGASNIDALVFCMLTLGRCNCEALL